MNPTLDKPTLPLFQEQEIASPSFDDDNEIAVKIWTLRAIEFEIKKVFAKGRRRSRPEHSDTIDLIIDDDDVRSNLDYPSWCQDEHNYPKILKEINKDLVHYQYSEASQFSSLLVNNIAKLAEAFNLNQVESLLIAFISNLSKDSGLKTVSDYVGELGSEELYRFLAHILALPIDAIRKALLPDASLLLSGIIIFDREDTENLSSKLKLHLIGHQLFDDAFSIQDLLERFISPAADSGLKRSDFVHLKSDLESIESYLKGVWRQQRMGSNILLYGAPGTGKTELAHYLAQHFAGNAYCINSIFHNGELKDGFKRLFALQFVQKLMPVQRDPLIIFDEIEGIFGTFHPLFGMIEQNEYKGALNQIIENNQVPTIWICNSVTGIDPAYLRRFDQIIEIPIPPRQIRKQILRESLQALPVSESWIHAISGENQLSPALINRAATVLELSSATEDPIKVEQEMERLLNGSLHAMGENKIKLRASPGQFQYDLSLLNIDRDVEPIIAGLKANPEGRFCLYGPPGCGKTEWGYYLSEQLEKPILIKRASDLLSKYIGDSEKQIALMFVEAEQEGAILLLDEADSFLRERRQAHHSWEVTKVNELLTQMEAFTGIFICSTNLIEDLDQAALRRFDFKISFGYLTPKQNLRLFSQMLDLYGVKRTPSVSVVRRLHELGQLTPGDYAVVARQMKICRKNLDEEALLQQLQQEIDIKGGSYRHRPIGFHTHIH